jgi:hypothetical protein
MRVVARGAGRLSAEAAGQRGRFSFVDVPPVFNAYHENQQAVRVLTIDHTVRSQSKPIITLPITVKPFQSVGSDKCFHIVAGIAICEAVQAVQDETLVGSIDPLEVFQDRRVVFNDPGQRLESRRLAQLRGRERLRFSRLNPTRPFPRWFIE